MNQNLDMNSETSKKEKEKFPGIKEKQNHALKNWSVKLSVAFCTSALSMLLVILLWFTDSYNQLLLQAAVLRNNSLLYKWYIEPPFQPILKVHVYNYTNIEEYVNGTDKKIKLQEVGPYIYNEKRQKINIKCEGDEMTWQEKRSHEFNPEKSGMLKESDEIIVPNIPLLGILSSIPKLSFVARVAANTILSMSKPQEFQNINISSYFFGYSDDLINLVSKIKWDFSPDDTGILAPRKTVVENTVTVNTGLKDSNKLGKVLKFKDKTNVDMWKSDDCVSNLGNDEMIAGPQLIRRKQVIRMFSQEVCRQVPLEFEKEAVIFDNIPTYHYTAAQYIASKPTDTFENPYYCESRNTDDTRIDGVQDVSECYKGSPPVFVSLPHFMEGDPKLFEHFEGLSPNKTQHYTHGYFHPRFSVLISGVLRLQANIKLSKYKNYYKNFPNGIIFPIAWVETNAEDIPDDVKFYIYLSTVVVDRIEIVLKYGSILALLISCLILTKVIIKRPQIDISVTNGNNNYLQETILLQSQP